MNYVKIELINFGISTLIHQKVATALSLRHGGMYDGQIYYEATKLNTRYEARLPKLLTKE